MERQMTIPYIDEFMLITQLGHGSFGQVYKAINKEGKFVAIKKFIKDHAIIDSIKNQFQIHRKLSHQNIVKVFQLRESANHINEDGKKQDCIALILQYAQGGDLVDFIQYSGVFSEQVTRTYFRHLYNAVNTLHKAGIVHRDIKLDNMLFDQKYVLKLADFGYAKHINQSNNGFLKTVAGTQIINAPQIYSGKYDPIKTDIFAMGAVLFMMYRGTFPFKFQTYKDPNYQMIKNPLQHEEFWKKFEPFGKNQNKTFSDDFKDLFMKLVCEKSQDRLSMQNICKHPWVTNQKVSSFQAIKYQFDIRKKRVEQAKEKQKQKQKQQREKNKQMLKGKRGQEQKTEKDCQLKAQQEKFIKQIHDLKYQNMLTQQGFIIDEELDYAFPALKVFLKYFSLGLDAIQNEEQSSPSRFTLNSLEKDDLNVIVIIFSQQLNLFANQEMEIMKNKVRSQKQHQ